MEKNYQESAMPIRTIYKWLRNFQSGYMRIDYARQPVEVTTPVTIEKVHNMVTEDRILKVNEIAKTLGILNDQVHNISHENSRMKKMSIRGMSHDHLLTIDQKQSECMPSFKKTSFKNKVEPC